MKQLLAGSLGCLLLPLVPAFAADARADFDAVARVFEFNCLTCHHDSDRKDDIKGDYSMTSRDSAFKGGEAAEDEGPAITPGDLKKSNLYARLLKPNTSKKRMPPPKHHNGDLLAPLKPEEIKLIASWIEQGATWPSDRTLVARKKEQIEEDETVVVASISEFIVSRSKGADARAEAMQTYTNTVPGTMVTFTMVPIRGGEFVMGSPESEANRGKDEGPQRRVKIEPFWMGRTEVTWNEYELFMYKDLERANSDTIKTDPALDKIADASTRPTRPYVEMSFGMGKDGFPAISMTQHAANKYCEWLSAKTGEFYRLPTEAEWEYACRAGTTTPYSFGNDPTLMTNFAWYFKNADGKYQKVGVKQPNPWGLYDMHGNVAEWCLDQYTATGYQPATAVLDNPWNRATRPYPQVARGGSWDDDPEKLRSAARRGSDPTWKQQDPQLPKSKWWLTDAQFLGLRIVRPLKVPTREQMYQYWNSGLDRER